jgi:hypothetical protein
MNCFGHMSPEIYPILVRLSDQYGVVVVTGYYTQCFSSLFGGETGGGIMIQLTEMNHAGAAQK